MMKKYISILLIVLIISSTIVSAFGLGTVSTLSDIEEHWIRDYKEVVYFLQHIEVLKGYSDNTFKPQNPITREEFIKILIVALGADFSLIKADANSFIDVPQAHWSYQYIEAAIQMGIIYPLEYGTNLDPQKPITRQEIAFMLARALEGFGRKRLSVLSQTSFLDDSMITEGAKPYVQAVYEAELMKGYSVAGGFNFGPHQTTTRAEAAIIIYRLIGLKESPKKIGFYAIDSYKQIDTIKYFDEIIFGWSALMADAEGNIRFTLNSTESKHRLPNAYQEPLNRSKELSIAAKLMVTDARTSVIYPLLESKAMQEVFIKDALQAIEELGMSGLVMDLENIRNTEKGYRAMYVSFLKDLQLALANKQYTLSVAVQPDNVVGYYDGFDFKQISEIAEDIILMAHDYYDRNTVAFATDHAPLQKVKGAVASLLAKGVAKNKLILAIQIAGATQVRSVGNEGNRIYTPTMTTVYEALTTRNGVQGFDYNTMTPSFTYVDSVEDIKGTIKYENRMSVNIKLLLAKFYGIKGVSYWRLGELQQDVLELLQ